MADSDEILEFPELDLSDLETDDEYEPDADERAEFREFYCRICDEELTDETAPCGEELDNEKHKDLCYSCLANISDDEPVTFDMNLCPEEEEMFEPLDF